MKDFINSDINVEEIRPPEKINTFEQEIDDAQFAHNNASQVIKDYIEEVQKGGTIDMHIANEAVQDCMQSVLRTPDAMMLMTHLKNKDDKT